MQHWPSHDGEERTIWVLKGLGKVRQLFLQQETRRSLWQLTANHWAATFNDTMTISTPATELKPEGGGDKANVPQLQEALKLEANMHQITLF